MRTSVKSYLRVADTLLASYIPLRELQGATAACPAG